MTGRTFAHVVVEALNEAEVEIGFRLNDVRARKEQPQVEQSVARTLEKVKSARDFIVSMIDETIVEMRRVNTQ